MLADLTNILQELREGESYLVEHGVPNARRNAEWLLAHVLGCQSPELYLTPFRVFQRTELDDFHSMLKRRGEREPLQYILGSTEFMSIPFRMRRGVFIPRPDTEVLVEKVEALFRARSRRLPLTTQAGPKLLDLCCGAGVIGISLARRLPRAVCDAVDIDGKAIALTRENAVLNGVEDRVRSVESDAKAFLRGKPGSYDCVVCNPPYVPTDDIAQLLPEVRDHEPSLGLDGGDDGLRFYRELIPLLPQVTLSGGIVAFEIGDTQAGEVTALMDATSFVDVEVHRDYGNVDRAVTARRA